MRSLAAALAFTLVSFAAIAETTEYKLDTAHTSIGFAVKHLMISDVKGSFKHVPSASIQLDDKDLTKSRVSVTIDPASVITNDDKRDAHLKGADFFDVATYKAITFTSKKITKAGADKFKVLGDLTIRNKTNEVTLDAAVSAPVKTPWNTTARGVKLTGKVNRKAFGLTGGKIGDSSAVIGDEVSIDISAEVTK